ncbi:MAG: MnhB domain-containing protein [Candidatus Bipolaricaulaceae bacterium]
MKFLLAFGVLGLMGILAIGIAGLWPRANFLDPDPVAQGWRVTNAVAAVVLGVRLWDTLLEVLVYVVAMVGVRFLLGGLHWRGELPPVAETPLLRRSADLLLGPILVFALYMAASGHLGPGGGFPAGAILGSALLLLALAKGMERVSAELYEPRLDSLEYLAVVLLFGLAIAILVRGVRTPAAFVTANLLIALEVAIGAWAVLHRFSSARGEV